jgi:hypothetical protein
MSNNKNHDRMNTGLKFNLLFGSRQILVVKGIVSRDWKGLQMVWIDLKFQGFCFMFIFNLNVVFTTNFLKVVPIRVRFSPGFPPGAGFPGEEFAPACF